jgi:hypothetical protein
MGVLLYTQNMSDNPIPNGDPFGVSADNQQERLLSSQWQNQLDAYLTGFADGEGSFNISFRKRDDYKLSWKVSACFNVSQKEKSILELFQSRLGCGTLRSRPDGVWYYEVNNLNDLCVIVIPFFISNPFLSKKKQRDFRIFSRITSILYQKMQFSESGIRQILELRRDMNDGGKRKYCETEILSAFSKESSETIRQTDPTER